MQLDRIKRRDFITLLGAGAAWPLVTRAQEAGRTYRVGGLAPSSRSDPQFIAMFDELRRSGFIEGQNLTIDWRPYGQDVEPLPEFAAELVKSRVDVLFAGGNHGIRAAQRATATVPILGFTDDMVGSGLVRSLARPGGNTTGISLLATELDGKRQEILIEGVPGLRRMAVLADTGTTAPRELQNLQDAARARTVELSIHPIARPEDIVPAIDAAKAAGAEACNVLASTPSSAIAGLSYSASRCCACRPFISGRKQLRRAAFRLRPAHRPALPRVLARQLAARRQPCQVFGEGGKPYKLHAGLL